MRRRDLLALLAARPVASAATSVRGLGQGQGQGRLRRGINLTNWFRFPPATDPAALAGYLSDTAIAGLCRAGFDFVRLPVQPAFVRGADCALVAGAVRRLQDHGLGVIVGPHPGRAGAAVDVLDFWQRLGPALAPLDRRLTLPEVLNEPVFAGDPGAWASLQRTALGVIRASLPGRRVLLTGSDWGGIDGLLALRPLDDPAVLYSFHFYEPPALTSLAAYRAGLDRAALALLPFPASAPGCSAAADAARDAATRGLIRYVCAQRWDAASVAARIAVAAAWGSRHGVPVLLGEFGASAALNPPARLAWLSAVHGACEAHGIPWALWGYDDAMGFGIHPARGAAPALDPALLAALGLGREPS